MLYSILVVQCPFFTVEIDAEAKKELDISNAEYAKIS